MVTHLKTEHKRLTKFDRYYQAVNFLEGLSNLPLQSDYLIDKHHAGGYLKRMRYFLNLLGNPDRGLKFIHIAGTAGKGTVTNMVHEILLSAGKKVGSFTSPSVTCAIEKIKVDEKYIAPEEFSDIVDYLKPFINQSYVSGPYGGLSYFEIFFAIALVYFKKQKCNLVVLEVGLGGRYDATNVIEKSLVTAITNIDYDHTEVLGKTLRKIAFDKAGIIKKGTVFFTTEQRPALRKLFKKIGDEKRAKPNLLPSQNNYQEYNRVLATAICQELNIGDEKIRKGLGRARLMCRFEKVSNRPTIILDGAHNRSKIRTTVDNLRQLPYEKLSLVIGIAQNKDHRSILEQIIPLADHIFYTRFQNKDRKCAQPKELMKKSKAFVKHSASSLMVLDPEQALDLAVKASNPNDLILVVGSFFLAGELRSRWYPEEFILKNRSSY